MDVIWWYYIPNLPKCFLIQSSFTSHVDSEIWQNLFLWHMAHPERNLNSILTKQENVGIYHTSNNTSKSLSPRNRLWKTLHWRHNGRDSVSHHHLYDCLLNRLFRRRSKKTSKQRVTGLCVGNSPGTGEFSAQMASNARNISIWWRHHEGCIVHFKSNTNNRNTDDISRPFVIN